MAVCAYRFTLYFLPHDRLKRVLLSAALLTVWDLSLDPAMSHLSTYWQWTTPGRYYSMPWPNLIGWYITSLLIMSSYELLKVKDWLVKIPTRGAAMAYAINAFLPWGMIVTGGLFFGATVALFAEILVLSLISFAQKNRANQPSPFSRHSL